MVTPPVNSFTHRQRRNQVGQVVVEGQKVLRQQSSVNNTVYRHIHHRTAGSLGCHRVTVTMG